jgi:SOS response regulatory protein OraA/RecX
LPTVTALREDRRGRVAVELDGVAWRTLPADVVVRAGVQLGKRLERADLRLVRRELRRSEALAVATRALGHRDRSRADLRLRLEQRGVLAHARDEALAALERTGLVDDARFASSRAAERAQRGYGDAAIAADLERHGIPRELREQVLEGLRPEADRARALLAGRRDPVRSARLLATRGFGSEAIEAVCGPLFAPDP